MKPGMSFHALFLVFFVFASSLFFVGVTNAQHSNCHRWNVCSRMDWLKTQKLPVSNGHEDEFGSAENCQNPSNLVRLRVFQWHGRFKVSIRSCANVTQVRLHAQGNSGFLKGPNNVRVLPCHSPRDTVVISHPMAEQNVITAAYSGEQTNELSLVWDYKYVSNNGPTSCSSGNAHKTSLSQVLSRKKRMNTEAEDNTTISIAVPKNCGKNRSCVRFGPEDCKHMECDYLLTYSVANRTFLELEISGKTDGWVALGLSSDNKMGGDEVIACKRKSVLSTELGGLAMYTNVPYSKPRTRSEDNLKLVSYVTDGSFLYCKMTKILPLEAQTSDTSLELTNSWFQFYAKGPIDRLGFMLKHNQNPPTSLEMITMLRPFYTHNKKYTALNTASLCVVDIKFGIVIVASILRYFV